ncbi:hexon assembly-associated protein [Psittacine adenovirus 1]|uniref:Hexon assembly-associated protein n=1 Tax=Psittacine adenovirus 1 TaxID=318592 RepID=A0A2Z5E095_9ADEN|nr:hexon assembly-associated protein [Psittacine adenovirus 1]AXB73009.1 hexon assembly-associated protein [Psittacine adenovirus 1]
MEGTSEHESPLENENGQPPQGDGKPSHQDFPPRDPQDFPSRTQNDVQKTESEEMVQKEQPSLQEAEAPEHRHCDEETLPNEHQASRTSGIDSGADADIVDGNVSVQELASTPFSGDSVDGANPTGRDAENDSAPLKTDRGRNESKNGKETERCFCHFRKAMERQASLIAQSLPDTEHDRLPLTVETLQYQFERYVFNPNLSVPIEQREVRYNFYPPFLLPKAICSYHIFALTAPIPPSCKANRSNSEILEKCWKTDSFRALPKWKPGVEIDDSLGSEVVPVGELNQDVKLVPLQGDTCRLLWAKERGTHLLFFSYPSLHMPPRLSKLLMETLLQPFADEITEPASEPAPCVSDEELMVIVDPENSLSISDKLAAMQSRRLCATMAVRYCVELQLMERIFKDPSMVRKMQEVLHHTFHHGYVRIVRETAKVNLSNFSTFHGVTYNNPLNNCIAGNLMEGSDKADYLLDSIYLFLVMTWQTAMGMWHQAIETETIEAYKSVLEKQRRAIYAEKSISDMSNAIVDILLNGDVLGHEMRKALPNFITQSQISAYRHFLLERSNIPQFAAPFLPSDFIPLRFKECQPVHWQHVYLLRTAFFLLNHGGYLWEPYIESDEPDAQPSPAQRNYCPCNLCSPHRMPLDNMALHNEVLAIGTFEIRNPEGRTFKLTPELWTNVYLDRFVPDDFFPFIVCHYSDKPSAFTAELRACVTQTPEILALIRRIQESREEFLLSKGKGVYKDPHTGEVLSGDVTRERAHLPPIQAGAQRQRAALPSTAPRQPGRIEPPEKAPRALRAPLENGHGEHTLTSRPLTDSDSAKHGSKHAQRESGGLRGARDDSLPSTHTKRRHRRRLTRQPGLPIGDIGRGGALSISSPAPEKTPTAILKKDCPEAHRPESTR